MTNRIMVLTALFMLLTTPSWAAWNRDGNLIRQATGLYNPQFVDDGQGGAYVAFRDSRSGNYDVYVQHIDSAGAMLGTLDGDVVGTNLPYMYWDAVATGDGGVAVFWNKTVAGNIEIMAQNLDASGSLVWGASDAAITSFSGSASMRGLTTILDPTGSIFLSWESDRSEDRD